MTYEYLCTACAHAWEAEQKMSEKPLTTCPNCHTENAKRQVSGGAGFILKGGGWYADLYGSAPKKAAEGAGDGATSGEKSASAPKKDAGTSDAGTKAKADSSGSTSASTGTGTSGSGGSSSPAGSKPPGASAA